MVFQDSEAKKRRLLTLIQIGLLVLFIVAYWNEVFDLLEFLFLIFIKVILLRFPFEIPETATVYSLLKLGYNFFIGFLAVFFFWMLLVSAQALLPVINAQEIQRTAWHLLLFILRRHGQAIFVKNGKEQLSEEDRTSRGPGVVVLDFNSAVVLEERMETPGLMRPLTNLLRAILRAMGFSDPRESPRACGPGIVFTHWNEVIRGVVDLRKQFRILFKVPCYTREGIELTANLFTVFTVGQDPDVLDITFIGERKPENLRILTLERLSEGRVLVKDFSDDLEEDDRAEIYHFARVISHTGVWNDFIWLPPPPHTPVFNRERVFAAVFAQARASGSKEVLPWTELPTRVASEIYRQILSEVNYDELYDIKGNGSFPLPKYKGKLRIAMRNNGILSFRLVFLKSGRPLERNAIYRQDEFVVSEVRPLTSPKVLRDRGIKVLFSGFSDPQPVSDAVYKHRLDSWRAKWESDLQITTATRELEAMRVRSRARAQAQKDLAYALARIFESQDGSEEAIALRIMQALEKAAADPLTRQLLPGDTLNLMRTIHALLLPAEIGKPTAPRSPVQEN